MDKSSKGLVIGGISAFVFVFLLLVYWVVFVPPYNEPKFVEIEPHETAFILPMDWDQSGDAQKKFNSVEFLAKKKVAGRRVQIPKKWVQNGRWPSTGYYQDTVRVVKVSRTPVVREWVDSPNRGSSKSNDSIDATSKDSIAFSFGFTATAYVEESNTAAYLYNYRNRDLSSVMDQEIRAGVQSGATEFCTGVTMDLLRGQQNEIVGNIKKNTVEFFKERGITLTNMNIVGRFKYENPKVQSAVDDIFVAQQMEDVNVAKGKAQIKENERLKMEAEGVAVAAKIKAEGLADAAEAEAAGKAKAIRELADAKAYELTQAVKDKDFYLQLMSFDLEKKRLERWDGQYPTYWFNGAAGKGNSLLIPTPRPPLKSSPAK